MKCTELCFIPEYLLKKNILYFIIMSLFLISCASGYKDATSIGGGSAYPRSEQASDSRAKRDIQPSEDEHEEKPSSGKEKTRMMIYEASLHTLVQRLDEALIRTEQIIEQSGGYVETKAIEKETGKASFRLRVPANMFEKTIEELSTLGKVLTKNISARDITKEFSDVARQLQNKKQLLERLYELLKKTDKVKERIKILNEISRLNQEIEAMQAQKDYLQKKASYSTIQLEITSQSLATVGTGSLIYWIQNLRPERVTLLERPKFTMPVPEGFLDNSKLWKQSGTDSVMFTPEGVKVRTHTIENDPQGDVSFYTKAIEFEQNRYQLAAISKNVSGNRIHFILPRNSGYENVYYGLSIIVVKDELHIIEVFYPSKQLYEKYQASVNQAMASIEN